MRLNYLIKELEIYKFTNGNKEVTKVEAFGDNILVTSDFEYEND